MAVSIETGHRGVLTIAAAVLIGSISNLAGNLLPAFLPTIAHARGLTESQAGISAFADLGGIAVGTIGCAMLPTLVGRLNWRRTAAVGMAILIIANLVSTVAEGFGPYLAARMTAGFGGGISAAIVYATLGERESARSLGMLNVMQLLPGVLLVPVIGPLTDQHGIGGMFLLLGLFGVIGLIATTVLPAMSARETSAEAHAKHAPETISFPGWLAIAAVLFFTIASGANYAYIVYMGIAWGISESVATAAVQQMLMFGMAGAAVSALLGSRFGFGRPVIAGYLVMTTALLLLLFLKPVVGFFFFGGLLYFGMMFPIAFLFEAVTRIDRSSSAAMLVNAAILGGYALGPAIAGYVITPDYGIVNGAALIAVAASFALIVVAAKLARLNLLARNDIV